ncbi:leucine-rich repeat-containing G-protein coupled receptor 5-like isoform X2 [Esox lucius]|uniref:leucine-rich repeat-containing G-protein coupled receptor 5-like isoform X2 n=1 Tax=Esox lucius TaxID=8010 RepID=UPI0014778179|nr:leucine-rich repeat-containing G-protein coupled receptor 5-like isoform X2 [Esox lucius]
MLSEEGKGDTDSMRILAIMITVLGVADCAFTERSAVLDTDCPSLCKCEDDGMLLRVECVELGLVQLPSKLSMFTSYLDLSMNNITLLPREALSNLPFLQELRLAGNHLTDIPEGAFIGLFNLKVLMLQNNNLRRVPNDALENLRNLRSLRLDANRITSVPAGSFKGLASLRHLWLDDNALSEVPVRALDSLPTLQALTLALNSITHVPDRAFANLTSLVVLHLHNNKIQTLGERCFDGLLSLESLTFHSNYIRSIPEHAFVGNPSLITIYFYNNPIQSVGKSAFQNLPELQMLALRGATEVTEFPDLTGTNSLETLAVTGTHISTLPRNLCDLLPNLVQLDLSHNLIQHLPRFSGCRKIQKIDLRHNHIHEVLADIFLGLTELRTLDLSFNLLSSVPLEGLQDLTHLRLAGNTALRPSLLAQSLPKLRVVEMPYAFQCCAFVSGPGQNSKSRYIWKTNISEDLVSVTEKHIAVSQENEDQEREGDSKHQHPVHCFPSPGPRRLCQSLFGSWPLRAGVWLIVILSFACNSLVLVSIVLSTSPTPPTQYLLAMLSGVHLVTGLSSATLAVLDAVTFDHFTMYGPWLGNGPACWVFDFLSIFSAEASVFLLAAIVLERGWRCTVQGSDRSETCTRRRRPLGGRGTQGISALCCVLAGAIAILPPLIRGEYGLWSPCIAMASPYTPSSCLGHSYATALVLLNSLCYLLMTGTYMRLYCHMDDGTAEEDVVTARECSVTRLLACLLLTNCLLSFPVALLSFFSLLRLSVLTSPEVTKAVLLLVAPLPACLNPLLYILISPHFKEDLNRLLCWMTYRQKIGQHSTGSVSVDSEDAEKQSCDSLQALVSPTM